MRLARFLLLPALMLTLAWPLRAHETRPGFLVLREVAAGVYTLTWKRPTGGEVEIAIDPVVPAGCRLDAADRQQQLSPGALVVRGTLTCEGGLADKRLRIAGLESTITDVLVRIHHADGRLESHLIRAASPSVILGGTTTRAQRALTYFFLGIQHILLGADHLLFVLGLLLLRLRERPRAAPQRDHCPQHPLPRPRDRAKVAGADQLHHPAPVGGRFCLRPPARLRLRQRPHRHGTPAGGNPARAAAVQRRRRSGATVFCGPDSPA